MIASIVIPARNRNELAQRAVDSVLNQPDSALVQIIIVDDASDRPLTFSGLRAQDIIIRNSSCVGAAVSRNRGIDAASGDVIYLLDSDDEFLDRYFIKDMESLSARPGVQYCQIVSNGYRSKFPERLSQESFLSDVFGRQRFVAQTSSLCFPAALGLRFDESLPKHQDWDFIFMALRSGHSVHLGPGSIHFDRADSNSLSRAPSNGRSAAWIKKLQLLEESGEALEIDTGVVEALLTSRLFDRRTLLHAPALKLILSPRVTAMSKAKFLFRGFSEVFK